MTKKALRVPVTLPTTPGRYRLTVTLHDTDGVAYDAITQALIPTLIVRVTGDFDGDLQAAPTADLQAGADVALGVRVRNLGIAAWGAAAIKPTSNLSGYVPAKIAKLTGRWIPLAGGAVLPTDPADQAVSTDLPIGLAPGKSFDATLAIKAPKAPGSYLLLLDVVTPDGGSLVASGADPTLVRVTVFRRSPRRFSARGHSPSAATSRSMNGICVGLIRRRASSGSNQPTRSISGKTSRRPDRGGHSISNVFESASAASRSPSTAQAWTILPPFWTIEPSGMAGAVGSIGVPVSSTNSRRATTSSGSARSSGSPFGMVQSPRSRSTKIRPARMREQHLEPPAGRAAIEEDPGARSVGHRGSDGRARTVYAGFAASARSFARKAEAPLYSGHVTVCS